MDKNDKIYRELQKHLDKHNVFFPKFRSGVDIRILKHHCSPQEAKIMLKMDYKYEPVEVVYERLPDLGVSYEEFGEIIEEMVKKGGIMYVERNGEQLIKTLPFVVGMYERKAYNLTPEYVRDFREITSNKTTFGLPFISTEVLQMRTIPIEKSVEQQELTVASYDSIRNLIVDTTDPIVVNECICRQAREIEGQSCQSSKNLERCLSFRELAQLCIRGEKGRVVSKEEALEIIQQAEMEGLVLQPSNAQEPEFVCCCCKCCCVSLGAHQKMPKPARFWATNYYSVVDTVICEGCGICAKKCPTSAITHKKAKKNPKINLNKCIGCGVCVVKCPNKAMKLVQKEKETLPPKTDDDLYELIMQNKRGRFRSVMRMGKKLIKK